MTVHFSCDMHIALNRKKLKNKKLFMSKSIFCLCLIKLWFLNIIHKQNNVYYNFSHCEMFILLCLITFPSLLGLHFSLNPRKSPKSTCNMMLFFLKKALFFLNVINRQFQRRRIRRCLPLMTQKR